MRNFIYATIFLFLQLTAISQQDQLRRWEYGIGANCSYYSLVTKLPYWKNVLSYEYGLSACVKREFGKKQHSMELSAGFASRHYSLLMPDLNHLFLYQDDPFLQYKKMDLNYFNFPLSCSFQFNVGKRFYLEASEQLNFLYMPKDAVPKETYETGSTGTQHNQQTNIQVNSISVPRRQMVPNLFISVRYSVKKTKSDLPLGVSKCLLAKWIANNNDYYDHTIYNVSLFTDKLAFSGLGISLSYIQYFK